MLQESFSTILLQRPGRLGDPAAAAGGGQPGARAGAAERTWLPELKTKKFDATNGISASSFEAP